MREHVNEIYDIWHFRECRLWLEEMEWYQRAWLSGGSFTWVTSALMNAQWVWLKDLAGLKSFNGWQISDILSSPISKVSIYISSTSIYSYLSYCFIWLLFTPTLDHFCWRIPRSDFLLLQLSSHCSFAAKGTQDAVKRKVWPLEDSFFHLIFRCNHLKRRDRGDLPTVQWIQICLLKPEEMQKQEPTRPYSIEKCGQNIQRIALVFCFFSCVLWWSKDVQAKAFLKQM